jgi:hypothetical protein
MQRILSTTLALLLGFASAAVPADLVPMLPYMGTFNFNLYSGYIDT